MTKRKQEDHADWLPGELEWTEWLERMDEKGWPDTCTDDSHCFRPHAMTCDCGKMTWDEFLRIADAIEAKRRDEATV